MPAEEIWEKYMDTREENSKKQLTVEYLPLVEEIARRMSFGLPGHIEYGDLVSWGVIGLLDALDKFRPDKGSKFKNYAAVRIRGAILDELRRYSYISRSLLQSMKRIEESFRLLENKLGREASMEEVAEYLGTTKSYVDKVMNQVNCCSVASLETVLFSDDSPQGRTLMETVPSKDKGPDKLLEEKEKSDMLKNALEKLNERDRLVLSLYYCEELIMKEIGEIMDISESRVSQIHSRAVMKLRRHLAAEE